MSQTVLSVGAHAADFVWRSGGALAAYAQRGDTVVALALTYGERGESAALWDRPGVSVDQVKDARRAEAEAAATELGITVRFLDFDDHPLEIDQARLMKIVSELRDIRPDIVLTHLPTDPLNADHPYAADAVLRAVRLAAVPGVLPSSKPLLRPSIFFFEPDQPEFCGFRPNVFLDISNVMDKKIAAMKCMETQGFLVETYEARGSYRGHHARRIREGSTVQFAEAYERHTPYVGQLFEEPT